MDPLTNVRHQTEILRQKNMFFFSETAYIRVGRE